MTTIISTDSFSSIISITISIMFIIIITMSIIIMIISISIIIIIIISSSSSIIMWYDQRVIDVRTREFGWCFWTDCRCSTASCARVG